MPISARRSPPTGELQDALADVKAMMRPRAALIGGIIEQAVEAGLSMSFPVRVVPVGEEIWSVGHVISLVVRAP